MTWAALPSEIRLCKSTPRSMCFHKPLHILNLRQHFILNSLQFFSTLSNNVKRRLHCIYKNNDFFFHKRKCLDSYLDYNILKWKVTFIEENIQDILFLYLKTVLFYTQMLNSTALCITVKSFCKRFHCQVLFPNSNFCREFMCSSSERTLQNCFSPCFFLYLFLWFLFFKNSFWPFLRCLS